jgi:hypothetical protein
MPLYGTSSANTDLEIDEKIETKNDTQVVHNAEPKADSGVQLEHEEMRPARVARRPVLPTKAEVDEHFPLHLQYRDWCKHCRYGKAKLAPHIVEPSEREKLGVTMNIDFAFMGSEEAEEDMQPALVMYDDHKLAFWAAGVKTKAVTEPLVKYVKDIFDQSGYEGEKLSFKSDQEPAMVALKRAVAAARTGETVPIESPVRASKSNGMMERAIGVWQAQLRTIKHFTEEKLGKRIEVDGVLFSWLIPYCTEILNKFRVGPDGRTAYERIVEHKCRHAVFGFAESIDFILENSKKDMHKADSRVHHGIFLGYIWRTTEYIVGNKHGVFKCRTVRRRAEEVGYDPDCTEYLTVTHDDYVMKGAKSSPGVSFPTIDPDNNGAIPVRGREFVPRRVYIKAKDYETHGFTDGCRGCIWFQNRLGPRLNHTEACRERIEKLIEADETDERTKKAKERLEHFLEQCVKDGDEGEAEPRGDKAEQDPREEEIALRASKTRRPRSSRYPLRAKTTGILTPRWRRTLKMVRTRSVKEGSALPSASRRSRGRPRSTSKSRAKRRSTLATQMTRTST